MQKYIILLLLIICLSACEDTFETTLNVDPPPHTPQMTVHAFLMENDESIGISVGRTFGILDNVSNYETQFLSDATIEISQQGILKYTVPHLSEILPVGNELLPINYGLDLSGPIGGINDSFEIKVIHADYDTLTSVQYMPQPVAVTTAIFEKDGGIGGEDGGRINIVDITFTDPGGEDHYYEIALAYYNEEEEYYDKVYTMSGDPNLQEGLENGHLLNDLTFDGKEYTLRLDMDDEYDENMVIVFRTISENWYLYSRSMSDFRDSDDFGFFAEPVTVHSNIGGGLGIFAAGVEVVFPVVE